MPDVLPWAALISAAVFIGFVNTHQRHASRFQGSSQMYLFALLASATLGLLVGVGLFIYDFMLAGWFWTIILFLAGSFLGGIAFGTLDSKLGLLVMSLASFIGWPAAALWFFSVIRGLSQ